MNQDNFVQWERVATTSEPGEAMSILKEQLTKIKLLSNELAIRNQQLEILKEQVSELEAQREEQDTQAVRSEKRWNGKEEELNSKIYSLQAKNEGLGIFSQQLIERVKGLNQQACGFERETAQLRLQLDKASAERCCFIQELNAAKIQVSQIKQKQLANELEERAVESRTEVLAAKGDNSLLIQDSERLQNEIETLKGGIACLNGEIEKKKHKIEQQEKKNIKKDERIQQLEEKIACMEEELRRCEIKIGESAKLGAENSQLRVEVSNLKSRAEESCRTIENLKANIARQEDNAEKAKTEIKQNKKIIQEIKKKNETLVSESLNAQGQILELRESMERAENARDRELRLIAELLEEKLRDEDRRGLGKIKAGQRSKEMIRTFQNSIISSQISRGEENSKDERKGIEIVREKIKQLNEFCDKQRARAESMEEQHGVLNERIEKLQQHADELCQLTQSKAEEQDQQIVGIHMNHQEELHQLKQLYDMKIESMTNKIDIDSSKLSVAQQELKQGKEVIMQLEEEKQKLINENAEIFKKSQILGSALAKSLEGFRYIWSEYAASRNSLAFLRRFIAYHSTVSAVINPKNKPSLKQRLRTCVRAVLFVSRVKRIIGQDQKNKNMQKEIDSKDSFQTTLSWAHRSIQTAFLGQNTQSIQDILNQLLSSKQSLHQTSSASLISQILRKCMSYPSITTGRIGEAAFKAKSSKDAQRIVSLIKENEEFQSELAQMTKRVLGLSEQTKNIETQIGQSLESKYIEQLTEKDNLIAQILKNPSEFSAQKSAARRSFTEQITEHSEETRANNWSIDPKERQLTHPVVSRTHSLISHAQSSGMKNNNNNNQSVHLLHQELSQIMQHQNVPDSLSTHSFYSQNIGSSIAYSSSSSVSQSAFLKCPGKIVRNASKKV